MKVSDLPIDLFKQMEGWDAVPADFEFDGCTGVVDIFLPIDRRPACAVHDWRYTVGGCSRARAEADREFYRNLIRCDLWAWVAFVFWLVLRMFGGSHFNWKDK